MIQNTARPRGRPRSFDDGALEKATQVFSSKGYDGVTIDDLVAGMGVSGPSLYRLRGRAERYSCASLGRTQNGRARRPRRRSLSPQGLRDSIAGFLRFAVESATEKGSARGWLWCASRRL